MPLQRCQRKGQKGWKWGSSGTCYIGLNAKAKAQRQARAAYAAGYAGNKAHICRLRPASSLGAVTMAPLPKTAANGQLGVLNASLATMPGVASPPQSQAEAPTPQEGAKGGARPINPLRHDPSRTSTLRKKFAQALTGKLRSIMADMRKLIAEEDAFGLKDSTQSPLVGNQRYGAVMVMINDKDVVESIYKLRSRIDGKDVVEYETEPHVTARYGFTESVDAERVQTIIDQHGPVVVEVGQLSLFRNEEFDVLKLDILSPALHSINAHLGILPNVETHREYHPHLTVAYLKPGTGDKYLGPCELTGKMLTLDDVVFSTAHRDQTKMSLNQRWRFNTTPEKLAAFQEWILSQLKVKLLDLNKAEIDRYWMEFIEEGFKKGQGRAFAEAKKGGAVDKDKLDFYKGSKEQFLSSSFNNPESVEKLKLLTSRTFTDLQGITQEMATRMTRTLADGLVQGQNPRTIAGTLAEDLKVGITRAERIARTEIIRAHAEGAIQSMKDMGVQEVGVMVEWSTAGDSRVCPKCRPLEGIVLKIEEAEGMFPRHPNCRCTPIPANLGEPTDEQKRTKTRIEKAIKDSVKAGKPKKRTMKEQRKRESWIGVDKKIDKKRPKSLV